MEWEIVMGLEVHTELATKTKIFCGCSTEFGGAPNTHVCEICAGLPGTLPLLNRRVVEFAVRTGLATNCEITRKNKFDRKNYFYPDLPKAYQISQLYLPICRNGYIEVKGENGKKYLAHTLNNTVVAPPRMLIAFLENNLQADGSIRIPEALRMYMGGKESLRPAANRA